MPSSFLDLSIARGRCLPQRKHDIVAAPKEEVAARQRADEEARKEELKSTVSCKHFGCQVEYSIADNGPTSCRYHASAPVFHEGIKKWVCCGVKKYDFDEFLAVPGCVTGPHEPEDDE